jgi:ABC-type Na+ efflux pump permease subunit
MNRTLIANYLRHRASSPMRVALIVVPSFFALGSVAMGHSLAPIAGLSTFFGMVLAAGAIGQDVSSGTLQLLLARPVTRPGYVMSRWIASGVGASVLHIGIVALSTIIVYLSGEHPPQWEPLALVLEGIAGGFGSAAVLIMFSALLDGLGDVAVLIACAVGLQMTTAVAAWREWATVARISQHLQSSLAPALALDWMFRGLHPSWFDMVSYGSTVAIALSVAILRVNRRELSYAANA